MIITFLYKQRVGKERRSALHDDDPHSMGPVRAAGTAATGGRAGLPVYAARWGTGITAGCGRLVDFIGFR